MEHCVHVAHSCPSGAITFERHDGGPQESAPSVNVVRVRENGPYAVHAQIESTAAEFRVTLCRCGKSNRKPYCDGSHAAAGFAATGEPATIASEPLTERGGRLAISSAPQRPPAAERQFRDLLRYWTHGFANAVGATVSLRRFRQQAVLRRLTHAHRLSLRSAILGWAAIAGSAMERHHTGSPPVLKSASKWRC